MAEPALALFQSLEGFLAWEEEQELRYELLPGGVIVSVTSEGHRLDIWRRIADESFDDEVLEGVDAVLELPEIGAVLTMAEIYEDTSLAAATGDTA